MTAIFDPFRCIADEMYWRAPAVKQIDRFESLIEEFKGSARIAGTHRSKSIHLPVVEVAVGKAAFTLRDNFHDVNMLVRLDKPCMLPLAEFFAGVIAPRDWDWYLGQVQRARDYTWRDWTDEELADPRILCVKAKSGQWREVRRDEKERWSQRLTDPAWYAMDWSSSAITWEGTFGPGVQLFCQPYPFAEGIQTNAPRGYRRGSDKFLIAVDNFDHARLLMHRILKEAP